MKTVRFLNIKYNKITPFVNESVRDKGTLCFERLKSEKGGLKSERGRDRVKI